VDELKLLDTNPFINAERYFEEDLTKEKARELDMELMWNFLQSMPQDIIFKWMVWGCEDMAESHLSPACRVVRTEDRVQVFNIEGREVVNQPLEHILFSLKEGRISIAWFDEEEDNIYHSMEIENRIW